MEGIRLGEPNRLLFRRLPLIEFHACRREQTNRQGIRIRVLKHDAPDPRVHHHARARHARLRRTIQRAVLDADTKERGLHDRVLLRVQTRTHVRVLARRNPKFLPDAPHVHGVGKSLGRPIVPRRENMILLDEDCPHRPPWTRRAPRHEMTEFHEGRIKGGPLGNHQPPMPAPVSNPLDAGFRNNHKPAADSAPPVEPLELRRALLQALLDHHEEGHEAPFRHEELAHHLRVDPERLEAHYVFLERGGYIESLHMPDPHGNRARFLSITKAGEKYLQTPANFERAQSSDSPFKVVAAGQEKNLTDFPSLRKMVQATEWVLDEEKPEILTKVDELEKVLQKDRFNPKAISELKLYFERHRWLAPHVAALIKARFGF